MLQKMRSGAQSVIVKIVLFGLLMLAMLGLAFTDVQGMFRGGSVNTGTVATIGGQKIGAAEFDAMVQRNLRQQQSLSGADDAALRRAVPLMTINQEVNARLFARAAYDLGIILDDRTAAALLKKELLAPLAAQSGMSEKDALATMLRNMNMSERTFVETFKSQVASDELVRIVSAPVRAPEQLLKDALKRRHEWRRGQYFELTAADLGDALKTAPSDEELRAYYDSIAGSFLLPEYRDFNVLLISRDALGLDDMAPSAEEVAAWYAENSAHFAAPEQRRIEQLIAQDEMTAQALKAEAEGGATLADIARKAKTQTGVAAKTVFATSTYAKDELDVELAAPAFDAKPNSLVGPVKTPLGWHVMKIVSVTPARTPPLAEVRAEIEKEMTAETSADALYKRATEIDDMVSSGQSLRDIAASLKLEVAAHTGVTSEGADKSGRRIDSKLPAFPKIVETAFSLDEGQVSQLTETSEGGFLLIETVSITPAQEQPFDAVRDEVADSLRLKKMGEAFDRKSAEITEKMQLGESFEAVAKRLGKSVRNTALLQRASTPAEAGVERGMLPALFSLDKVGQTTAVSGNEKVTILRLSERKIDAPRDSAKADSDALRATLDDALRNDILEQYRAHLFREYKVSINDDLITRMYSGENSSLQ